MHNILKQHVLDDEGVLSVESFCSNNCIYNFFLFLFFYFLPFSFRTGCRTVFDFSMVQHNLCRVFPFGPKDCICHLGGAFWCFLVLFAPGLVIVNFFLFNGPLQTFPLSSTHPPKQRRTAPILLLGQKLKVLRLNIWSGSL